jgi:Leucine-rich repeat (LRR) protein
LLAQIASVGGSPALSDSRSPQNAGLEWILANPLLDSYSARKVVQRYVLATLYYSTMGESWTFSDGWLSDQDECEWHSSETAAAICSTAGDLDEIDLDTNGLVGSVPWIELALLSSQLVILDFFRNEVEGSIPSQLGLLTSLASLDLYSNQISGKIPTEIGLLTLLTYQDCDTNFLSGTLPTEIADMFRLESLWLNDNLLSGTIPSEIGKMANLRNLYLTNNYLSGSVPQELCALNLVNLEVDCEEVACDCCTNANCINSTNGNNNGGNDALLELLTSVSPDGGLALQDSTSPQYAAFEWLRSPINIDYMSDDKRMFQRYALATLYYSTQGVNWNTAFLWLTSANECLWFTSSDSRHICDTNRNLLELDLRGNNLNGRLPDELLILSETLGEYDTVHSYPNATIPI